MPSPSCFIYGVWLFLWGRKEKRKKQHVGLKFSDWTSFPLASEWCGEIGQWNKPRHTQIWCGHAPWLCLPGLIWAGLKRHCLSFSVARNHACASSWIEGCVICKIPKDNFIYSCCKQCLYKVFKYVTHIDLSQPISSITSIYVMGSAATIILYAVESVITRDSPWQLYER